MSFGRTTTADEVLAGLHLDGKVAIVTGASSGLGAEVTRALRAHGADVVAAVRDPSRTEGAGRSVELDLTSLESVRRASSRLVEGLSRIDLLFNNAGVMATPEARTIDGFELQMATNHLGHFLLTALLAPAFAPNARVVNTTSSGHMITGINWHDPHFMTTPYEKWQSYGQSKTANILFTRGLANVASSRARRAPRRHRHRPHPPPRGRGTRIRRSRKRRRIQDAAAGRGDPALAATSVGIPSGSYLADCQIAEAAGHATAPEVVEALWAWSEQEVRQAFPA